MILKTENTLPKSSNLLSPWLCVLVHTASLVWFFSLFIAQLRNSLSRKFPHLSICPTAQEVLFLPLCCLHLCALQAACFHPCHSTSHVIELSKFFNRRDCSSFSNLNVQHSVWPVVSMRKLLNGWMFDSSVLRLVQNTLEAILVHFHHWWKKIRILDFCH